MSNILKEKEVSSGIQSFHMATVSQARIWLCLIGLMLVDWLLGMGFSKLTEVVNCNNATRFYYRTIVTSGADTAFLNLFVHWLPRAAILFIATILVLKYCKTDWRNLFVGRPTQFAKLFIIAIIFLVAYHLMVNFVAHKHFPIPSPDALGAPLTFVGLYVVRFLPSAFAEEVVYRGGIFVLLERAYGKYKALGISVVIFALGHGYGDWGLLVNSIMLGVVFSMLYIKTRSLLPCIFAHMLSNVVHAILNY